MVDEGLEAEENDFFVRSVRYFRDQITDPDLQRQVAGFIGQESVHGREHRAFNRRLAELNQIGVALSQEKDLNRLLELILIAAKKITNADGGTLYRRHADKPGELAFEINGFSRDMVFMLQGLIVLFSGAMAQVAAPALARVHGWLAPKQSPNPAAGAAHG